MNDVTGAGIGAALAMRMMPDALKALTAACSHLANEASECAERWDIDGLTIESALTQLRCIQPHFEGLAKWAATQAENIDMVLKNPMGR
jgi:hypothetical protein